MHGAPTHPLKSIIPPSILSEAVLHPDHENIDRDVMTYLVNTWEWPSEKHKKAFVSWNLSEVVLFMFPTGETERAKLACELLLLGFLMDDHFDKNTLSANASIVSSLHSLLSSPTTSTPQTTIDTMHATLFAKFSAYPNSAPILEAYLDMLDCHCIPSRGPSSLSSLKEYLKFRETDVGMPICVELLYWTDPSLSSITAQDRQLLRPMEKVANYHVSILNDVFSFEREWKAAESNNEGGALVNGVAVLAEEANISLMAARGLCVALVRAWEVEFLKLAEEVVPVDAEARLRRAVEGIKRRMSGAEAFSWRTRRYL
ncbi:putative terpene cyclase [Triangularia setosa]|uniref:Terpene synthase n=1 Tax=Triangularia setosa TaxID=2587417 RepID=A0AAN7A346_9PEZI|nr:putative terpene cyclase [Podospora setosa]